MKALLLLESLILQKPPSAGLGSERRGRKTENRCWKGMIKLVVLNHDCILESLESLNQ